MIRLFWCRGSDEEIWNEIMKEASEELTRKKSFLPLSHAHLEGRGHHNAAKKQHLPTVKSTLK